MFLIETNKARRLLHLSYIGHVQVSDLRQNREELVKLLAELPSGFYLLPDLSHLESMDIACEDEIARSMKLFNKKGVEAVIRVIPEPGKDIGFNILTMFHYDRRVRVVTCRCLKEALEVLQKASSAPKTSSSSPQ